MEKKPEKKPDLMDIFKHVIPNWDLSGYSSFALDWITVRHEDFCKENSLTSDNNYDQFRDWLLEKYWPDWKEREL